MSEMTGHQQFMCRRVLLGDVFNERQNQHEAWGEQEHNDGTWLAILIEEVGEAGTAILRAAFPNQRDGSDLRAELVQVAAVAVSWIEAIDRRSEEVAA